MVGWLTLRLSRVSFCDPQADSGGGRQQATAAPSGELADYRPGLDRISDPIVLEASLTTTASSQQTAPTSFGIGPIYPTGAGTPEKPVSRAK